MIMRMWLIDKKYLAAFLLLLIVFSCATAIGVDNPLKITSAKLGGELRYLVFPSTDKPLYREGETVYLRNVILNAADNTPALNERLNVQIKIEGPRGDVVFEDYVSGDDSTVGMSWSVPRGIAGGEYTAVISSPDLGFPAAKRSFEIRAYRAVRIKSQIEFPRKGYGPGDRVHAVVSLERAEGGIPEDALITAMARIDGKEVYRQSQLTLTDNGTLAVEFDLPDVMSLGNGTLAFIVEDGGMVETASQTIPIVLQDLEIAFYPEGGDLVDGLESRVYFQANRPDGKPADIAGRIVDVRMLDSQTEIITTLQTQHEGRGVFTFRPEAGVEYALVLDQPSGIERHFPLPESRRSGITIRSAKEVYEYDEKISITVNSVETPGASSLTIHKREITLDSQPINSATTLLDAKDSEGVLIVTAWDANGVPIAERLVFRKPRFALNVDLKIKDENLVPGGNVSLDILTTDQNGNPVEAVVGVTVTDDAVLEMIESREQAPRLPVMVYLEGEVKDLSDASIYLDTANPQAPQAVDLMLGTQGWRRFILVDYDQIKIENPPGAKLALAAREPERSERPKMLLKNQAMDDGAEFEVVMLAEAPAMVVEEKVELNIEADLNVAADIAAEPAAMGMRRPMPTAAVREYSFQVRGNRKPNERVDFTETLYWHKGIRTSARDGRASITFGLSDSITTFRVMADAFGRNGSLGSGDTKISSVEPFYIEPLMPLEVTVGDEIEIPVTLVNASTDNLTSVRLIAKNDNLDISQPDVLSLSPGERRRVMVKLNPKKPGSFPVTLSSAAGPHTDTVTRVLVVKPAGFPVSLHHGGLLGPQSAFEAQITLPVEIEPGSLAAHAKVYPSPLASMEEALNALLRQPNGCFEQTSSTNYPLVMAQQYFMSHQGISGEKIAKARDLLESGYSKLIGFETDDKGYEWFGASPAHEALTAYGLMEFVDMSKVMSVDTKMISRTREWLLDRRDGKGGFKRNERALDSFGAAPAPTTNAYIVWALLESGEDPENLTQEIAAAKEHALNSDDYYSVALTANILYLADDSVGATILASKLADAVNKAGAVDGALTSITRSGGDALLIETTSLAILAWLKDDAQWAAKVEESIKWLFERSKSGQFGSTQSTILALKAINAYDAARAVPKQAGSVQLLINDQPFGKPVHFDPDSKGAIELPDFSAALSYKNESANAGGSNSYGVALRMEDGSKMPFAMEITYNTSLPVSSETADIDLDTRLSASTVDEGEILELEVIVSARENELPTPIAIVGIPAGLEVRHDQLKELVASEQISSYEVVGREVHLYWRVLKAMEQRVIPVSLTAKLPGRYTAPASRAYLYYTDELKRWSKGHEIVIRSIAG